jgi:hypothetical protein
LARRYAVFAEKEARGRYALYEKLAFGVGRDRPTLEFLGHLPAAKQQPNLLFAAVRFVCGTTHGGKTSYDAFTITRGGSQR